MTQPYKYKSKRSKQRLEKERRGRLRAETTEYDNYTTDRNSRFDNYMIDRNSRDAVIRNMTADAVSLGETAAFISFQRAIISSTPGVRSLPRKLPRCLELQSFGSAGSWINLGKWVNC